MRRNRRRFWKSENDDDKAAAYLTLYTVIVNYIKIMSPVIPFITDKIYQNLVRNISDNIPESIHLTDYPEFNKNLYDEKIIWEIDSVKEIVSLGRSARNKVNIKVRQPLKEISVFFKNESKYNVDKYKEQITQELNVKNVCFISDISEIVSYNVKPNFNSINSKYEKNRGEVISFIQSSNSENLVVDLNKNKKVLIPGTDIELLYEDLIIEEIANEGCFVMSNTNAIISINTILDKKLIQEGIVRDLIRKIQNLRKESDLKVEDRIYISIISDNEIYDAVDSFNDYFLSEVLGLKLTKNSNSERFKENFNIKDFKVELGITKV